MRFGFFHKVLARAADRYARRHHMPKKKERRYGDNKTIHRTTDVNVEIGPEGDVVSVWFRCALLPFTETRVGHRRAVDMREQLHAAGLLQIKAIVFEGDME